MLFRSAYESYRENIVLISSGFDSNSTASLAETITALAADPSVKLYIYTIKDSLPQSDGSSPPAISAIAPLANRSPQVIYKEIDTNQIEVEIDALRENL